MIADVDKVNNKLIFQVCISIGWIWDNRFWGILRYDEEKDVIGKKCWRRNRKGI